MVRWSRWIMEGWLVKVGDDARLLAWARYVAGDLLDRHVKVWRIYGGNDVLHGLAFCG